MSVSLWKLFSSTFTLSMFTVGGGYVIVPLMRKKFVQDLGWIEEEEMLDLTAMAQSAPGAMAVNASILVGYRVKGFLGAFVAILGTILPPMLIISVISFFYEAFRDNLFVGYLLKAMQAAVAAVILDVVLDMALKISKKRKALPIFMMVAAFVAAAVFDVNIIIIILICGVIGGLSVFYKGDLF